MFTEERMTAGVIGFVIGLVVAFAFTTAYYGVGERKRYEGTKWEHLSEVSEDIHFVYSKPTYWPGQKYKNGGTEILVRGVWYHEEQQVWWYYVRIDHAGFESTWDHVPEYTLNKHVKNMKAIGELD